MSTAPREVDHGTRTVDGIHVRVTELVWADARRSFEVHFGDIDLTENACLDGQPTDAQIRDLLAAYSAGLTVRGGTTDADVLRHLLTAAGTQVGWQVDLDQIPFTCAHTPHLVVALIDAAAAYLAALATRAALTDAAQSLQAVLANADPDTVDWSTAELLGTVAHLSSSRSPAVGHTRRALIAALQPLHEEGAAWPPDPTRPADPIVASGSASPAH